MYTSFYSEFIAGQQRAKIVRLEETVQSLHNKLREALRAKSQAERNLAFQILENDRQKNRLERLKVYLFFLNNLPNIWLTVWTFLCSKKWTG